MRQKATKAEQCARALGRFTMMGFHYWQSYLWGYGEKSLYKEANTRGLYWDSYRERWEQVNNKM